MDIIKSNINNLTSLWKSATEPFQGYLENEDYGKSYISNSQWPNKIWTKKSLTRENLDSIISIINQSQERLIFTYFDKGNSTEVELITQNGFKENFIQYGMSLKPKRSFETSSDLKFRQVKNMFDINRWSHAFEKAFGYKIDPVTIEKSHKKINYFLIENTEIIVGTIILYQTDNVAGIHSLGIIPEMRGKGFAKVAMHLALNLSSKHGVQLVTLQASEMAKSMYEKLGFTTQFIMRNYSINI